MVRLLRETFPKSIEIRTRFDRDLGVVQGDVTQLNQVLMNLAINARDAMPSGGVLEIGAANLLIDEAFARRHPDLKPGLHVLLSVQDSGTGVPPEIVDRIFDPFFTTKPAGKGTGLGLSTVLGIIKGHGGCVQVGGEPGAGARFDVYLPALPAPQKPKGVDSRPPLPRGQGEGVLVVDDEEVVRTVFATLLKNHGYTVLTAANGEEALAIYRQHQAATTLVIMDMLMPGMDGLTAIRELRKMDPEVRVLIVSGMMENDQFASDEEFAGLELIRKPVMAELLLGKVAEVVGRG
jgi:CheY-like chemotaxis protein